MSFGIYVGLSDVSKFPRQIPCGCTNGDIVFLRHFSFKAVDCEGEIEYKSQTKFVRIVGLNYINDFSKQHSIFLENRQLVKNVLLLLSIFSTFSFERYFFFWGYSISFPLILST